MTAENTPDHWIDDFPVKEGDAHKYDYGHALIYGAPAMTGATRLAASACARVGAGLVSVLCSNPTYDVYRTTLPPHIICRDDLGYWHDKVTARLYGSGGLPCDVDFWQRDDLPTVLDADALFGLPERLSPSYILTPHEGEFVRLFPDISGNKEDRARMAAERINAIVVLKGEETVIASPVFEEGSVVNSNATPYLATAGSGDVLAGMITGLLAQGMTPFFAACAAVWIHGQAGVNLGAGLVASDIEYEIPKILKSLTALATKDRIGFV